MSFKDHFSAQATDYARFRPDYPAGLFAWLAGIAPMNRDSGRQRGKRHIRGGRVEARNALYIAAWVAKRHSPKIKAYADRLKAAGKPFKVIMIACMRKLLIIANLMLKSKSTWNENLIHGAWL